MLTGLASSFVPLDRFNGGGTVVEGTVRAGVAGETGAAFFDRFTPRALDFASLTFAFFAVSGSTFLDDFEGAALVVSTAGEGSAFECFAAGTVGAVGVLNLFSGVALAFDFFAASFDLFPEFFFMLR